MKILDKSEFRDPEGKIGFQNRLQGTLRYGFEWASLMAAQDQVCRRLEHTLGDEFVVLRNLNVPGISDPVPMILIGPQGVWLLSPSAKTGIFRAKDSEWLRYDSRNQAFKRLKPNLQAAVIGMSQTVLHFIQAQGYGLPEVHPVLVFTNPRAHVDTARPTASIVMADAVDHFANGILQGQPIMDAEDIHMLVEALTEPPSREDAPSAPVSAAVDLPAPQSWEQTGTSGLEPTRKVRLKKRPKRYAGMTLVQWAVLAVLTLTTLAVVAAMAALVLGGTLGI
jgi:hypothetical protein